MNEKQPKLMTFASEFDEDMYIDFGSWGTWDSSLYSIENVADSAESLIADALYHLTEEGGIFDVSYTIYGFYPTDNLPKDADPLTEDNRKFWITIEIGRAHIRT